MEKRILQFLVTVFGLWAIFHFWHPFWRYDLNEAVDSSDTSKVVFVIEKGSSAETIAEDLANEDLIVSELSFVRDLEEQDLAGSLRYGSFVLSPSMTLADIVSILTTEGTGTMALTVPEGFTIDQIDARLAEQGLITAGEFKTCTFNCSFTYDFLPENRTSLEGYLFPDTYFIDDASFSVENLINQMLQNFQNKMTPDLEKQLSDSKRSLNQVVIVASMLEREVRDPADLATVSGIIWKRLDADWMLGIDATLLYKDSDGEISAEDLASDNPYNTRLQKGLPPTAIGNPGIATLEAALAPQSSDYWYYLTGTDGLMHYAKTDAEHVENKAKYLN